MTDLNARSALDGLKQLYADYLTEYAGMEKYSGLERMLRGGPDRAERKSVADFYAAVEQAVDRLRGCLSPEDSALAAEAIRFMLFEADGTDSTTRLTFVATQALVTPLLDFLSREDASALLADYTARYPRKNLLTPRQKELLEALKQRT